MTSSPNPVATRRSQTARQSAEGLTLLVAIVVLMWIVEVVNSLDHNALNGDGAIYPATSGMCGASSRPRSCTSAIRT